MRTKLITVLLLVLSFFCIETLNAAFFDYKGEGLKQGQISINEEGYKLKEVLKIDWGDTENKISISKTEKSKTGPDLLAVDNDNNIYLNDPGKKRIIKYTSEGKTVFINNLENIASVFGNGYFLDKKGFFYNSGGEFLYRIEPPVDLGNIIKAIQNRNTIFIIYDKNKYIKLKKSEIENKLKNNNKLMFAKEEISQRIMNGYPSSYFDYSYTINSLETNSKIEIYSENKIIKEIPLNIAKEIDKNIQISSSIIGDDDKGNMYTFTIYSYSPWKRTITIRKYNKDGKLLLSIRGFDHWQDLDIISEKTISIDNKGNIYQLGISEDRIKIYCWEK